MAEPVERKLDARALAFATCRYHLGACFLITVAIQMKSVAIGCRCVPLRVVHLILG